MPPPWKRGRRSRTGPQHHAPRGHAASQIARPHLERARRIAGSDRDRTGLLAGVCVGAQDSRTESLGGPQHETLAAGDATRVVDVFLLGHVGGPRDAVEPALRAAAIPSDAHGPRHRVLGPVRQSIARLDDRAEPPDRRYRVRARERHGQGPRPPARQRGIVQRLEGQGRELWGDGVHHDESRALRVVGHVLAANLEVQMRASRAALTRPGDDLPRADRELTG